MVRPILDGMAVSLIVATFFFVAWEFEYFRKQKRICQKYPFYKLRDEIVREMALSENPEQYMWVYDAVNRSIERLKEFNFAFYSEALMYACGKLLEEAYRRNFRVDAQFWEEVKKNQMNEYEKRFIKLVLETARANSLALRLATTKIGRRLLLMTSFIRAVAMFLKRHPDLFKKLDKKAETVRDYSVVSLIASRCL